jgi:neutral ceramidase
VIRSYDPRHRSTAWKFLGLFLLALVMVAANVRSAEVRSLRASVVKVDITPDKPEWLLGYAARQSTGVHDHIFHRIVALDDGETQFFLIQSDLCVISPSVYDDVARELEKETGIKRLQVWWTVTHTHSAPEVGPPGLPAAMSARINDRYQHEPDTEYTASVEKKLIEGVKQARANLEPARLGVNWGMAMANINRRARDEEGPAFLGMNPDGPVDRRIGLIRLEKADGKLLALIANYPMHGTVLGPGNLLVSGDAPGVVEEYVEEKLGAPMLFINGAAGNVAPIYSVPSVYPDSDSGGVEHYVAHQHLSQFRVLLGDKILDANRLLGSTSPQVKLSLGEMIVETPRKPELDRWAPDLGDYIRKTSTGATVVRIPIRFLKINNDIAIWTAPLELFNEIAVAVRNGSPFPYTFYFGYCNGWLGYMPTKAEFAFGGYEPSASPYTDQAEEDLSKAVLSHLQGMTR